MRYFLTPKHPDVARILLVESGPRHLLEGLLPYLRRRYGEQVPIGLVTCFTGFPAGLDSPSTAVYRVSDYRGHAGRKRLYRELSASPPSVLAIICCGVPIMTKWKWALVARLPAKVMVVNENGDFLWLDRAHWTSIRRFMLFRAGLSGSGAIRTLARAVVFPVTLAYLILYAAMIHLRRKVHG